MSRRQRRAREKRRRQTAPASRVRTATISGSLAAATALGLATSEPADAASFDVAPVKDINLSAVGSNPSYLTEFGGTLLFSASDGPDNGTTNGFELWSSDGTGPG